MPQVSVLLLGLDPAVIDYAAPAYARFPGLDEAKLRGAMEADEAGLRALGYDARLCLVDEGATAEAVLERRLAEGSCDCVLFGAGLRLVAENTALFERLVNLVHERAPRARLCFNAGPHGGADAVRRWFPTGDER